MIASEIGARLGYTATEEELAVVAELLDALSALPVPEHESKPATGYDPVAAIRRAPAGGHD